MNSENNIYRIMDVNLNRACEGLRVIEDGVRFILNDYSLTREVKELRHWIIKAVKESPQINQTRLIVSRDIKRDVGVKIKEDKQKKIEEMIEANFRRVEEAERSMEEFGKLFSPSSGEKFKQLRFRTYSLEKKVRIKLKRRRDLTLYIITDSHLIGEDFEQKIKEVVSSGASVIQLREKNLPRSSFLKRAIRVRKIIPSKKTLFIVNDRVDIAVASQADGVHLGQEDLPLKDARKILEEDKIIGISTHSLKEALKAEKEGADYIAIGPIFPTSTKASADLPKGTEIISQIKEAVNIPVVAIGGINEKNVERVLRAGADGVAVISAIFKEKDAGLATRNLYKKIKKIREKMVSERDGHINKKL
ncbi:MAG: thiamine phosphate synthase [Candidatus Aerophobetes bacterium]|nr:thiamine phosphate synthase [Candidatus Aerophobetes bacterium]